ncbi:MAG TPA: pitrilysin family protein [Allosphingosinicella sp.]|jgi:predicted Zn-dependent peptidase
MKLTVLPNGLKVASREMPGIETAAVGLYAEAGSRHEPARLNGIAHLFEHMVFKGAGGRSAREISEAIEDVGGDLNASTDRDGTSFMASVLAEHVPLGVELVSDLVLKPHFDASDLEREKDVVLQELGEARDTPSDIIFDELWSAAFDDQPLGRPVLGDEASLAAIRTEDLEAWRSGLCRGGGVLLVGAGKIEHDRLVALAEAHLGGLPPGEVDRPEPARFTGGVRVGRAAADQAHLALAFPAPAQLDPDYFAARLFSDAVGGGMSSRLFQQVREDRGLAYSVYSQLHPYADTGLFYVYAATARRESAAAAQLIEEIVHETAESVTQREVDRVRTQSRAALLMSIESPWGQAHYVARQLAVHGRLVEPAEVVAELEAVTVDQVREAGRKMLSGPRARATIGFPAVRAA